MKRIFLISLCCVVSVLCAFAGPKYVFYFIGDGMGPNQVLAAEMYRSAIQGVPLGRVQTEMTQMPFTGYASTHSKSNGITDSAAAGTCLATGSKTNNGTLGLNADGYLVHTIAEDLKAQGWGVGIMTTVAIDHATPAAFYAHVEKRNNYYTIGQQLSESGFDFFGGAGFHYPQGKKDNEEVNLYRLAEQRGYTIAHGFAEAVGLQTSDVNKMILVQSTDDQGAKHGDNLKYTIDRKNDELKLAEIVSTAISFLDKRYDRFFMMVEGGMIDYACHADDGRTAIDEVWNMDEAMKEALAFYREHPDETLIVVTADHETGGMALGNSDYTLHLDLLQHQKCSAWELSDMFNQLYKDGRKPAWQEVKDIYRTQLGFWDQVEVDADEEAFLKKLYKNACKGLTRDTKTMYKAINQLGDEGIRLLNKKAHLGWTSHSHTAHHVPVFAIGKGAEHFTGWYDNTELVPRIKQAIAE